MIAGIKEKILDTAYALFRDKGYEQATLRAIAEACGVTHANVLYHFNGKADIARNILLKYLDALKQETDRIAAAQAVRPSVANAALFWVTHLCYMVEYPDFAGVYVDILRNNRDLMTEIMLRKQEETKVHPLGEFFSLRTPEIPRPFSWKMAVLTDADYRTIEMLEQGTLNLREAASYMIDLISMLFAGKKIAKTALEQSVSLMLDLVKKESLERIHGGCGK